MEPIDLAIEAARAAGAVLLEWHGRPRSGVETKSSATDLVSDADRAAEGTIIDRIGSARPGDGFIAEESGTTTGTSGMMWVIDPLDGTTNFLFGIPQWCVSIAAELDGAAVLGVVYDPLRDELFAARLGGGSTLNGRPIGVSGGRELAHALVATGFSYRADERARAARMLTYVIPHVRDVRRAGSAALDLCWVAAGRLDAYYESPTHHWDRAAGELIVGEAGGRSGVLEAIGPSGPGLIAATPDVYDGLRALVVDAHAATSISPDV